MAQKYLLNCPECGQSNEIETRQAGQQFACAGCEQSLTVGTLREIRQLPMVESATVGKQKKDSWSQTNSWLFVVGATLILLGGLWAGYHFVKSRGISMQYPKPPEELSPEIAESVDRMSPSQMLDVWEQIEPTAVDQWMENPYLAAENESRLIRYYAFGGLAVAGVGLLNVLGALFLKL